MKDLSVRLVVMLGLRLVVMLGLRLVVMLGLRLGIKPRQAPQAYSNPDCASPTKLTCDAFMLDDAAKASKAAWLKAPRFNWPT